MNEEKYNLSQTIFSLSVNFTSERQTLLSSIRNLTEQRDQLKSSYHNQTDKEDQVTEEKEQRKLKHIMNDKKTFTKP